MGLERTVGLNEPWVLWEPWIPKSYSTGTILEDVWIPKVSLDQKESWNKKLASK
jgi:hypothetical protein